MKTKLLVAYHSPCMDGFGAACAHYVSTKLEAVYKGVSYGLLKNLPHLENFPWNDEAITHILFLDICPTRETLDFLTKDKGFKVVILDHHETAKSILMGYENELVNWVIADEFSGASLTLHCSTVIDDILNFKPTDTTVVNTTNGTVSSNIDADAFVYRRHLTSENRIFQLLEVRDLWLCDDVDMKAKADNFAAYAKFHELARGPVCYLSQLIEDHGGIDECCAKGAMINAVQQNIIINAIENSYKSDVVLSNGKIVKLCIGLCPENMGSMFGDCWNTTTEIDSVAVGLFTNMRANEIGVSIRSDCKLARLIAEQMAGGGHDNAAGCVIRPNTNIGDLPSINVIIRRIESILINLDF